MDHKSKIITDKEADESVKSLISGKVLPATEFLDSYSTGHTKTNLANDGSYSTAELKLLKAIVENPMQPSSKYPSLARISPNTFQKLRPIFIDKGFIREHKLESGGRGRSTVMLEPLELAKKIIAGNTNYKESC